jgi:hypothetical protein
MESFFCVWIIVAVQASDMTYITIFLFGYCLFFRERDIDFLLNFFRILKGET